MPDTCTAVQAPPRAVLMPRPDRAVATPRDSQVGARICNGLGIMRACLESQKLEQLEARMDEIADRVAHERTGMDEIADRVAHERTGAARERTSTHEAQRLSH
jgi:hypothetical protein